MKKILIPVVLVVALLVGAFGVSGAFAQDPTNPTGQQTSFVSRVAKILGIEEQKLTSAFTQAAKELRNEQIDKALAEGRITKELADWLKARPDNGAIGPGFGRGMRDFGPGMHGFGFKGTPFGRMGQATPTPTPRTTSL